MGNIGSLSGIGKMENGGNKLYCVTISNKYSFYSSVQITNVNEFRNYLQTKNLIRVFGTAGSALSNEYQIRTYVSINYINSSSFSTNSRLIKIQFSSGAYTGGTETSLSENTYYTAISSNISCVEV